MATNGSQQELLLRVQGLGWSLTSLRYSAMLFSRDSANVCCTPVAAGGTDAAVAARSATASAGAVDAAAPVAGTGAGGAAGSICVADMGA